MQQSRPRRFDLVATGDVLLACGLFGIIATLNFLLFVESAGTSMLYQVIYGILAFVLDGTEIVMWIRGVRSRNIIFMILAICIAGIGLFSSTGAALIIATADEGSMSMSQEQITDAKATVAARKEDEDAWRMRIDKTPADFTTQLRFLATELEKAHKATEEAEAKRDLLIQQNKSTVSTQRSPMFASIATALGRTEKEIKLCFLFLVSVVLQISALTTTYHSNKKEEGRKQPQSSFAVDASNVLHLVQNKEALCKKPIRYLSKSQPQTAYTVCSLCEKAAKE